MNSKKVAIFLFFLIGIMAIVILLKYDPSTGSLGKGTVRTVNLVENAKKISEDVKDIAKDADGSKAPEVVEYLKQKNAEGALNEAEDIKDAIMESTKMLGAQISDESADRMTETLTELEDMGLSSDRLIDEADKLYRQYGEDFADHMEEAFVNAAKDAAGGVATDAWEKMEESIKSIFE